MRPASPSTGFPFTAVVGMDDLQLALILAAISPAIGGVLIRGEKGTAKSTAVRALTEILPPVDVVPGCRFSCDPEHPDATCPDGPHAQPEALNRPARLVELPVGATEDRVLGSLHLEKALAEGITAYEPGLLAAAHRGLLYVDEVNLLHDHLVDVLLDAAAMGRATVERDGVSVTHPARFVLVGTMNPEEGELRPQLLDRFGLTVDVVASRDPAVRVEVMRARLAYEADPAALRRPVRRTAARARRAHRQGARPAHRGDPDRRRAPADRRDLRVLRRRRHARRPGHRAYGGRPRGLVRPHRRRGRGRPRRRQTRAATPPPAEPLRRPRPRRGPTRTGDPGQHAHHRTPTTTRTARVVAGADPADDGSPADGPDATRGRPDRSGAEPTDAGGSDRRAVGSTPGAAVGGARRWPAGAVGEVVGSSEPYKARLLSVQAAGAGVAGRRSRAITEVGRVVGDRPRIGREAGRPHLLATIRSAAPHQHARGRTGAGLAVRPSDVRLAVREGREGNLVLFCVDASGSMGTKQRMGEVKTAIVSLLLDAYQRRDTVGLVTFAGAAATVALPPTGSVETAVRRLESLPTGGRTPLAEGLLQAAEVLRIAAIRDPRRRPLLVLVTDGRATHGDNAFARARQAAGWLAQQGIATVVVDCEPRRGVRLGLAGELAADLGAEYLDLGEVAAGNLIRTVTERKAA